ncbi:MAG TPA: SRPBCC family protein [Streptosporangiaceae bacterium]|nr:SRPBCC family protein [Streptosporangiaceae bacterium]
MTDNWPVADLDPVRRLRVLAASLRFPVYEAEIVLPVSPDDVWSVASDLERELPRCLSTVRSVRITREDGERLELLATGTLGQRARFDVVLRPGWCLMRSRFVVGAMAAVPEGDGTRFASLGGFRLPGARLATPLLALTGDRAMRRFAAHPSFA